MDDATSRLVLGVPDRDNTAVMMNAVKAQIEIAQRPVEVFTKFTIGFYTVGQHSWTSFCNCLRNMVSLLVAFPLHA